MTSSSCPRCQEAVTLPGLLAPDTEVRCPLCLEQFYFREVLDRMPPLLEVVNAPARLAAAGFAVPDSAAPVDRAAAGPAYAPLDGDDHELEYRELPEAGGRHGSPYAAPPEAIEEDAHDLHAEESLELERLDAEGDSFDVDAPFGHTAVSDDEPAEDSFARSRGTPAAQAVSARPRPRRRQRNPVAEFVKVVLGGLLAVPAAQLILWWMPGNWQRHQRDPVQIAATVAQYVPFVVPSSLRAPAQIAQENTPSAPPPAKTKKEAANGFGGFPELPEVGGNLPPGDPGEPDRLDPSGNSEPLTAPADPGLAAMPAAGQEEDPLFPINPAEALSPTFDPSEALRPTLDLTPPPTALPPGASPAEPNPPVANDPFGTGPAEDKPADKPAEDKPAEDKPAEDKPAEDKPAEDKPAEDKPAEDKPAEDKPAESSAPEADPGVPVEKLEGPLAEARSASERWAAASPPAAGDHRQLYRALANLAASTARHANDEVPVPPAAQQFLSELSASSGQMNLIGAAGSQWLDVAQRETDGAALYGTIRDVASQGAWTEVQLELAARSSRQVTLVVHSGREGDWKVGSKALVLGTIVTDPGQTLAGYEGSASTVVRVSAMHIVPQP